ncbi:MAG TPA: DNA methyltransferase [Symbiobacteriaceae bacterium]|nr:DNA methyltransferase [Symbiobacteriaceae bacterium]
MAKDEGLRPVHIDLGERGIYHTGNRLNDLTGREWVYATRSVINRSYPPSYAFDLRSQHGGQKPPELCAELISTFTKTGQRVLDPFMGVGGTLLGASIARREAVGIDLQSRWVETYHEVCRREGVRPQEALVGDARAVLPSLPPESFDLLLTDVPYWDMDKRRRSTGKFKRAGGTATERRPSRLRPFDGAPETLASGIEGEAEWLELLTEVFSGALPLLRPGAYLAVFIGDMYHSGQYHPLSVQVMQLLQSLGLTMKANLIWYDVAKRLHVYGYKYEFIPSMLHQNILVFRT